MENNLYRQINIEWIVKFFVDVDRLRAHEAAGESYIEIYIYIGRRSRARYRIERTGSTRSVATPSMCGQAVHRRRPFRPSTASRRGTCGSQCSSDRAPPDGEEEVAAAPALVWPPPVCRCKEEIRPQAATLALVWRLPSARPPPQGEAAAAPLRSSASRHTSSPQAEALLPLRGPPSSAWSAASRPFSSVFLLPQLRCCLCRSGATSLPSSTLAGDRGGRCEGADRGGAGRARRAAGANRGFPLARCSHLPHCSGAATSPRRPPPKPPPPPRRPAMSSSPVSAPPPPCSFPPVLLITQLAPFPRGSLPEELGPFIGSPEELGS